jgi:hypothetical protein
MPEYIGRHRPTSPHEIAVAERNSTRRDYAARWYADDQPRHSADVPREVAR